MSRLAPPPGVNRGCTSVWRREKDREPRPRRRLRTARRFGTYTAVTDCTVIEFDPDVLWLASAQTTRHFHEAFLATLAERLVNAEGALAEMLSAKNVTLF